MPSFAMPSRRWRSPRAALALGLTAAAAALAGAAAAGTSADVPAGAPAATVDLATAEGLAAVAGEWRYADARVVEVEFRAPGPDGQPGSRPARTYDIQPHAGSAAFDDAAWPVIAPESLSERRGAGRVGFNWYRLRLTVPEQIGGLDPTGSTWVLDVSVDDYAEVWVDGELARAAGQSGGSVVAGWNAANRLVIARGVVPGQRIQVAVFGVNGPLSDPPTNYIWVRHARLEIHPGAEVPVALTPQEVNVEVVRLDPAIDAIVGPNPKLWKLAEGFRFTEGPVWVADGGTLLFSDPNANRIYSYDTAGGRLAVFRESSGYAGPDVARYRQPGSNGLALDSQGRLTIDEHGNRRVTRLEPDGRLTVLADRYQGRRLNSPNDLVYATDGTLFFTDPPFGLPGFADDPAKELPFSGVYALSGGELRLLTGELTGPNGIALSPDERTLYVGDWDEDHKVVMRYELADDGSVGAGRVLFDMTGAPGEDAIDGIEVDRQGNLYVSGPGGLWVLSPDGRHLGTIVTPRHVHNLAWGDDGRTLYLCAQSALYRMRLGIPGSGPARLAAQ